MKKVIIFCLLILVISLNACQLVSTETTSQTTETIQQNTTVSTVESSSAILTSVTTTETVTSMTTTMTSLTSTIETIEIQSCEEQGIDSCAFILAEALSGGSFHIIATYEDLSDTQIVLSVNTNPNLVIKNQANKILSMKYGAINFKTKAITETTTLGHTGFRYPTYLNGNYNVDGVFLNAQGVIVYGLIAGVRFEVVNSEVELIPDIHLNNAYSYYEVVNGELVHKIAYNLRNADFQSIGAIDIAPDYLTPGIRYYSYDNHYFYTDFKVMTDDLRVKTYEHAVNENTPYYNYYQNISFRTKTNYTAEELDAYINNHVGTSSGIYNTGVDFISAQNEVYINGAMELAFAIHESGWGNSWIAMNKNNLFGINAIDSDPYNSATSFDTVQDCIEYHVQYFLGTRYFNPQYYVSFGTNFGNKYQGMNYKYASDAFWGEKIAKHYYNLDKELGFKDRNYYQIALLNPTAVGYYGPNVAGPIVYDPATYTYKGLWIPFAIMKEKDEFYVLRLPLGLNENFQMDSTEIMGPTDVFYVLKENVIIVN